MRISKHWILRPTQSNEILVSVFRLDIPACDEFHYKYFGQIALNCGQTSGWVDMTSFAIKESVDWVLCKNDKDGSS
jgi:hypothetical protein